MMGRMMPDMMQKLLAMFGVQPGGGAGMDPAAAASMMDPSMAASPMQQGMQGMQGPPMDEMGRWTDQQGYPIYDEDVPNLPPSLKAAGARRKAMQSGGGKRKAPAKEKGGKERR